jgi:protein-S-isoprenylcysteine O-methyltransferase Ste14
MEWYIPLTVLPAVALIILSTSNFLVGLNSEINMLEAGDETIDWVIDQKIDQLTRLGYAIILLYLSSLFFMISALAMAIYEKAVLLKYLMLTGVVLFTVALIFLLIYSIKAIKIKQNHLRRRE